jgi:hypothetical protein
MQHLAAPITPQDMLRCRITQRDTVFKAIDPDTGLGLRACRAVPCLDRVDVCTWFTSREQAETFIAKRFGASTLEIVRFDK